MMFDSRDQAFGARRALTRSFRKLLRSILRCFEARGCRRIALRPSSVYGILSNVAQERCESELRQCPGGHPLDPRGRPSGRQVLHLPGLGRQARGSPVATGPAARGPEGAGAWRTSALRAARSMARAPARGGRELRNDMAFRGLSSNSYASGSNQNTGNVLTGVPTTRVLRPGAISGPLSGRGLRAAIPR